jgi:class 3 adenylate cyclase
LSYSFYRYGNPHLVSLTVGSFLYKIVWQFVRATDDTPPSALSVLNVASNIVLVMLFIALAVAWGLSDTSRLKFVSHRSNVYVIALFFDLRGSTEWCGRVMSKHGPIDPIAEFMDNLLEWALEKTRLEANGAPDFVKFLGDGFLFVWEFPGENNLDEHTPRALRLACCLSEEYGPWIRTERWNRKIGGVPDSVGVGMYPGNVIRVAFENGSRDYLGAPINHAARMQDLARPNGGVVVPADVLERLDAGGVAADLCAKFTNSGQISTARGQFVPVRATGEVEIRPVTASLQ